MNQTECQRFWAVHIAALTNGALEGVSSFVGSKDTHAWSFALKTKDDCNAIHFHCVQENQKGLLQQH